MMKYRPAGELLDTTFDDSEFTNLARTLKYQ